MRQYPLQTLKHLPSKIAHMAGFWFSINTRRHFFDVYDFCATIELAGSTSNRSEALAIEDIVMVFLIIHGFMSSQITVLVAPPIRSTC